MKRFIIIVYLICLVVAFVACADTNIEPSHSEKTQFINPIFASGTEEETRTIYIPYRSLSGIDSSDLGETPSWIATSNDSWIRIDSPSDGYMQATGLDKLIITLAPNPSDDMRTGSIIIRTSVGEDTISIYQDSVAPAIKASQTRIQAFTEGKYTVDITANVSWSVFNNEDWIKLPFTSGSGNEKLDFIVKENYSGKARTAKLRIEGSGASETIYIFQEAGNPSTKDKIAIISTTVSGGGNGSYGSALLIAKKYGKDKVVHVTWPDNYLGEREEMIKLVKDLGEDPDIKAIIVDADVYGSSAAFDNIKSTRNDIFVAYITPIIGDYPWSTVSKTVKKTDLVLDTDVLGMGPAMVRQAQKLGAKTFVHYSFIYSINTPLISSRRDLVKEACAKLGLKFVEVINETYFDIPQCEKEQFFMDEIAKMVARYGKDTAFFDAHGFPGFVEAVIENGAIFPQPCRAGFYDSLPYFVDYHGPWDNEDTGFWGEAALSREKTIALIRDALAQKDMFGRVSAWPVDIAYMYTLSAAEYAIKWINGEVSKEGIDVGVLKQIMEDYAGVEVFLTPYKDEAPYTENGTGEIYDNFLLMRTDYLTFE